MANTNPPFGRWALLDDAIVERTQARTDIEDRGYQFGDGAYEVIRVYDGNLFQLEEHAARFARSLRELRIDFPDCEKRVAEGARRLAEAEELTDGIVYLQVTRGAARRIHQFPALPVRPVFSGTATPYPRPLANLENGVSVLITEDIRWLRNDIKSLNLLGAVLAKQEAKEAGRFEAVLHRAGLVTEGSSSNIHIVVDGTIVTHPTDNLILAGITRATVLALAREAGVAVHERAFTVEEFLDADEALMTSTGAEATPIVSALFGGEERSIGGGKIGPVSRELERRFTELIG
jgi:D-alanine transaminase